MKIDGVVKKKKEVLGKLDYKQFSQWRVSIYEMQMSELKEKISLLEYKLTQKEVEILNLKNQVHVLTKVDVSRAGKDQAKVEYERIKSELENELGYSLNDKVIDEITLEVKDLKQL